MAEIIQMMALSPTMNEGTIAQWLVTEEQDFKSGTALCEVETDKATMTYEAPLSGRLLKILVTAGSSAAVGQAIAVAGKAGEDWKSAMGSDTSQPLETNPASTQAALPELGAVQPARAPEAPPPAETSSTARLPSGKAPASPLARKLARDTGIDLRGLRGSGPGGRIITRDVQAANQAPSAAPSLPKAQPSKTGTAPANAQLRGDSQPVSRMRSIIAQRLSESYRDAPHYIVRCVIDMERLLGFRNTLNIGRGEKISLNAFVLKLAAKALEAHPVLNSSWQGSSIQYKPSADIGLAVAVEGGLIAPVVRHCEQKGILQIGHELSDLVDRARQGSLQPDEYGDASFTLSNLGMSGVEEFSAIINPPGVAILALGAIQDEAVVRDKQICIRPILHATLSADHRAVDGASAAAFIIELKKLVEEPALALL